MATPEQIRLANIEAIKFTKQNEDRLRTKYSEVPDLSYQELILRELLDPRRKEMTISVDNRTSTLRKVDREAFKRLEEKAHVKSKLDNGSNFMSHTTDYIPVIGSILRGGEALTRRMIGDKEGAETAGTLALISGSMDVLALPLAFTKGGMRSLAGSWIGGEAGKYIGQKYNSPYLGQFIGALAGGFNPQMRKHVINKVKPSTIAFPAASNLLPTQPIINNDLKIIQEPIKLNKTFPIDFGRVAPLGFTEIERGIYVLNPVEGTSNIKLNPWRDPEVTTSIANPEAILVRMKNYEELVLNPLMHNYGIVNSSNKLEYYRPLKRFVFNRNTGELLAIHPSKVVSGYYVPDKKLARVNVDHLNSTAPTHELLSHGSDASLPTPVINKYKKLVSDIFSQNSLNFPKFSLSYKTKPNLKLNALESKNWEELRATLNEIRQRAYEKGLLYDKNNQVILENIYDINNEDLLKVMSKINAYGLDYSNFIRNMNQEERNRVLKSIKTAMSTLPASTLLLTNE